MHPFPLRSRWQQCRFIGSRVIAQRDAYDWALAHPGAFPESEWNPPGIEFELIDGDLELLPGISLLATPGHAGHMSVVVRLPNKARSSWRSMPSTPAR
ncbi:MAG: hypothetical protein R2843_15050 [Thermomicrobiales bacterium]